MNKTLKQILIQAIQMMNYDYLCLELNIQNPTDVQLRSLTTLSTTLDELRTILIALPVSSGPLSSHVRHAIRNKITIISGYSQLLQHKQSGTLNAGAFTSLENILSCTARINDVIETNKYQVAV